MSSEHHYTDDNDVTLTEDILTASHETPRRRIPAEPGKIHSYAGLKSLLINVPFYAYIIRTLGVGVFESLNSYFESLNSYFESLNSYFESLNSYFETVADTNI